MGNLLLIGVGGALGAIARYWLGGRAQALSGSLSFPYGTLTVNLLGCLLIGVLAAFVARGSLPAEWQALLLVGLLGAFTTFSTFSLEALLLLQAARIGAAAAYVGGSALLGLLAVWAGYGLPGALLKAIGRG